MQLFDHFVGAAEYWQRDREPQRLGSLKIDDQLDFRDLLHRQIGGFFALENAARINANLAESLVVPPAVGNQTPGEHDVAVPIHRWYCMAGRELDQ